MKNLVDISAMLKLKEKGLSNRSIAKTLGVDKKTVNKYWNQYKSNFEKLGTTNNSTEIIKIQEDIVSKPKYNSENRVRRKITPEFLNALKLIIEEFHRNENSPDVRKILAEINPNIHSLELLIKFLDKKGSLFPVLFTSILDNAYLILKSLLNAKTYDLTTC